MGVDPSGSAEFNFSIECDAVFLEIVVMGLI